MSADQLTRLRAWLLADSTRNLYIFPGYNIDGSGVDGIMVELYEHDDRRECGYGLAEDPAAAICEALDQAERHS